MAATTFSVQGMHCAGCAGSVERRLRATTGVINAAVDLAAGRATVEYDERAITPDAMRRIVEELGYQTA